MSPRIPEQDRQTVKSAADLDSLATALAADGDGPAKKPIAGFWIALFAFVGVASSIAIFAVLTVQFWRDSDTVQAAQARTYREALQQSLSNTEILLHAVRATFHGAKPASQEDFASLATDIRRYFPGLQVISWLPRIKVRDIPAAERAAAAEGITGFRIRNSDGSAPADSQSPDDDVFPIYYRITRVGFRDNGTPPIGVNVTSAPERRRVLERACASGDMVAAVFPTMLSMTAGFGYLLLYLAVYDANLATTYPYLACSRLMGYVGAILRLDVLMATSFRALAPVAADVYLLDVAAPPGRQQVGVAPAPRDHGVFTPLSVVPVAAPGVRTEWLELGGREFTLAFVSLPRPWTEQSSPTAWLMLVSGLMLTTILTVFFARQRWTNSLLTAEVSRRQTVEQRLRASEYRFRMALRDSNVAVFSQDREFRYTWVYNPRIGIDARDMIGKRHQELFPVESNHEIDAVKRSVIETGSGTRREVELTVDGQRHFSDLRIEPLRDRNGTITGIICVAIDVTEARRMKEELSGALIAAEHANAAKSRFLAAASHDLRQPFQAMQLYHELLSMRVTDPRHQDLCRHLGESIRTGRELLTALLDVSVLNAGTITPKVTAFPLQPSLNGLIAKFREQAASLGIVLRLVETRAVVRSDRVLLERMLRNLVTNAVRYTPQGHILVGCRRRGNGLEIQVCDTGVGIAANQHELVFEDFFQVGNPERHPAQGLGLGLGIVARTARLLEHRLAMRSTPGRGSMFSITVPVAVAETAPALFQPPDTAAMTTQRVLVIEDDERQRYALRLLLEESGHAVIDAASSDEARNRVAAWAAVPTLIISDLRLPGLSDGIATIAEIRRLVGREIPAVLVTGDTDRERLRQAAAAGLAILHKPFNRITLFEALSTLVTAPPGPWPLWRTTEPGPESREGSQCP
jgi:PAS domain S-box-containing protein